jgi:hypothetical protein
VEAAAHPIDHPELVLLSRQAQEVEQEIAHGPIGVFDPPPLLVLVRALVLRSPRRRLDHGLALARIAGGLARVPGGIAFGARPVAPRRHRELPGIEGAALLLVMGKIRLAKDVGQKAKLVGPIEDRPDIAVEPGPDRPVPGQPSGLPKPEGGLIAGIDAIGIVEAVEPAIKRGVAGQLADRRVIDHLVHGHHVQHLRHEARIAHDDPGRIFHIDEAIPLDLVREHDEPRHDRAIGRIVVPAVVVGIVLDMGLAGVGLLAAGTAVAAQDEQPSGIVRHHLAQRIDGVGRELGRRKIRRIAALAAAIEGRAAPRHHIDAARPGIDDQPLAPGIGNRGVAPYRADGMAMLAGQAVELVPAGLLVGDVDAPLDVDEGAPVAAALHMVAELERPAFRGFLVIDEDLKPRGLALDAAFGILELHD